MRGQNDHAVLFQMAIEQRFDQGNTRPVQGGKGFIQDPEQRAGEHEGSKSGSLPLTLGKQAHPKVSAVRKPHLAQDLQHLILRPNLPPEG